jgi:drug/metabolite transporter (DMT)-like permease
LTPHARGLLSLVVVTLLWGTTFPLGKIAYKTLTPALLTMGRFVLSGLFMAYQWRGMTGAEVRHGSLLGVLQFACIACVYQGLLTIHANRSAFLVSTASIMVPIAGRMLGRVVDVRVWIAALAATVGIGLMTDPGVGLTLGDWWTLLSAAIFAAYIFVMERARNLPSSVRLTAVQTAVVAACAVVWVMIDGDLTAAGLDRMVAAWPALLYLSLSAIATTLLQGLGQRQVPAQEAAIVFTLEPVFATIFAWFSIHESLSPVALMGAGLVLMANLIAQWKRR